MTLVESIVLGVVQGLTEFLPISSTAHLRIVPALIGWKDPGPAFTAVIQLGTLVAVFVYFRHDIVQIVRGAVRVETPTRYITFEKGGVTRQVKVGFSWTVCIFGAFPFLFRGQMIAFLVAAVLCACTFGMAGIGFGFFANEWTAKHLLQKGWRVSKENIAVWPTSWSADACQNARILGWMIGAGTVPVVVLGLLFKHRIETTLRSLYVIAGAMIGLAVVLAVAEWFEKRRQKLRSMAELGWFDAIVVGCFQAVALIPGSSRSGCTISGGLFLGMNRETAARFSFLLSLPAVFAAGIYELYKERHALLSTPEHVHDLVIATVVSFIVGYASIAFLLGYLKKHTTWLFILYRFALGAVLLALLSSGRLPAL